MISLIECFIMNLYQLSRIGFSYLLLPRVNNNLHFHHSDGYGGFLRVPLRALARLVESYASRQSNPFFGGSC